MFFNATRKKHRNLQGFWWVGGGSEVTPSWSAAGAARHYNLQLPTQGLRQGHGSPWQWPAPGFKGLRLTAGRRPKGGYVGPTCGSLGQVGPYMFAYVSRRLPQVGPMLALCSPMIAHVGPMLALCWPYVGLSWPYVGPILALCGPIMSTNLAELC